MKAIVRKCLDLPYHERVNLYQALRESVLKESGGRIPLNPERGAQLLGYMEEVIGEKIPVKSRVPRYAWARTMVAYQLLQEGFTTTQAGMMIGKDHCTVIYMRHKMEDALEMAFAYKDIIHIWKQFQNKIDNEIHRGTT